MPHGISSSDARRLAREVDRYFSSYIRRIDRMSDAQRAAEDKKHPPLSYVDYSQLHSYLLGGQSGSAGFGAANPEQHVIVYAADAFGKALQRPELVALAAAVQERGL
jgi:hypothetical protein